MLVLPRAVTPAIAWESVYLAEAPGLVRYAVRLTGDTDLAADLVQDAFIRAMRAQSRLRDRSALRPWLYRIVTNLSRSALRRRALRRTLSLGLLEAAATTCDDVYERDHVRRALGALSVSESEVLLLQYVEGFSRAEIASITNTPEETVKSRLARGKAKFLASYSRVSRGAAG